MLDIIALPDLSSVIAKPLDTATELPRSAACESASSSTPAFSSASDSTIALPDNSTATL